MKKNMALKKKNVLAEVDAMMDGIIEIWSAHNSQFGELLKENPIAKNETAKLLSEIGSLKGQPTYFPYLGSGSGCGPYVKLEDGSTKLDLINGIGIHILGHSHPVALKAALKGALSDVVHQGNLQKNSEYLFFARKLVEVAKKKSRLAHLWVSTCGALANENALKIARQKMPKARKIIAFDEAFAGRTSIMLEITGNKAYSDGLPTYDEVLRIPFFDKKDPQSGKKAVQSLRTHLEKHPGDICCFWFEPLLGEGGYKYAPREFWVPLLEICKDKKIPVIADEVQTFGRTGEFFAFQTLGIGEYIDICTVGKAAQNGATLFTAEFNPKPGLLGGTFAGSSVSLSVGAAILEFLDSGKFMGAKGRIQEIHSEFVGMLKDLNDGSCRGLLSDAGGLGLMIAVTPFDGSKERQTDLQKQLYNNGLMSFGCGHDPYRIRFLLPAILSAKDIKVAKTTIEKSVLEVKKLKK